MDDDIRGFTCYWRIENFILRNPKPNLSLESLSFKIKSLNSKWHLEIGQEDSNHIGAFLFKDTHPFSCKINYSLSLLKSYEWVEIENARETFKTGGTGWGETDFLSWYNIANEEWTYLPFGALTICFRMWNGRLINESAQCLMISRMTGNMELKHMPVQEFSDLKPSAFLFYPRPCLLPSSERMRDVRTESTQTESTSSFEDREDLLRSFKEKDFNFVTLRTKNKDFSVFKAVLCAKSPVFNAMFERKMKENDSNTVDIDDIDCNTLSLLVRYLHFEPLIDLKWDTAMKLYYAADKYQIERLKEVCLIQLSNGLSSENVCDAFILADVHQDKELKQSALDFFFKNSKIILKSAEWKDLLINQAELASEILEKYADKL